MNTSNKKIENLMTALFFVFLFSIIFSLRAITSITIGLLFLAGLFNTKKDSGRWLNPSIRSAFVIGCILLFLMNFISLLYTDNKTTGWQHLRKSTGLLILPFAMSYTSHFLNTATRKKLITGFVILLGVAFLYCLTFAIKNYLATDSIIVFFYHSLAAPINQHAVQLSILVLAGQLYLMELYRNKIIPGNSFFYASVVCLTVFLFMLSSKLVLAMYFFYIIYFLFKQTRSKNYRILVLLVPALIFILTISTSNPVGNRFRDLTSGDIQLFRKSEFNQGMYFNGIQFRLLQWKFVFEILGEQNAWFSGLGPGDVQTHLDQKYIDANMYTGDPGSPNKGFLGYHTHNQFLQTFLQTGIIGLALFIFTCLSLVRMAGKVRKVEMNILVIFLILYCFTDAILETQYGIVIFIFLPLFTFLSFREQSIPPDLFVKS